MSQTRCYTCEKEQAYPFCTDRFHENDVVKEMRRVVELLFGPPGQPYGGIVKPPPDK